MQASARSWRYSPYLGVCGSQTDGFEAVAMLSVRREVRSEYEFEVRSTPAISYPSVSKGPVGGGTVV